MIVSKKSDIVAISCVLSDFSLMSTLRIVLNIYYFYFSYCPYYAKDNHINRLQNNECSIDKGFVLADLLSNIERISDHCSNIAGYLIDLDKDNLDSHKNIHDYRNNEKFVELYNYYSDKYKIQL